MIRHRLVGFLVAVTLVTALGVNGQEVRRRPAAVGDTGQPLLPRGAAEKLNLSAEQKEKIAKLDRELTDKTRDVTKTAREKMEKARADKDRAGMKAAQDELAQAQKARGEYESKVRELLTADQKKTYEELAQKPRSGPEALQLIPTQIQERLELTDEQKGKLEQLHKEFENKAAEILTPDQRAKLEQFRSRLQTLPRKRPNQD